MRNENMEIDEVGIDNRFGRGEEPMEVNNSLLVDGNCSQINKNLETNGSTIYIPYESSSTVAFPANFSCTYNIGVDLGVWVKVTILNDLENNDWIEVDDGIGHINRIVSESSRSLVYFIVSDTVLRISTTSDVSKALIRLDYTSYSQSINSDMKSNGHLNFIDLNDIRNQPQTICGTEKIVSTVARSGYLSDQFSAFFIFDGNLTNFLSVSRLDDFINGTNFVSTGNCLTVVGLDTLQTSMSSLILHRQSDVAGFDKLAGVTVVDVTGTIAISSSKQKTAVTFVANNHDILMLNSLHFTDLGNGDPVCTTKAISGPPTSASRQLIDFSPSSQTPYILPQLFPAQFFTVIVEHCSLQLTLRSSITDAYYTVTDGDSGYIFSPSYLDPSARSDFNVTYGSLTTTKFEVSIDEVHVENSGQIDICVIDSEGRKASSIVITGDQNGSKSRATGSFLNIVSKNFNSSTSYLKLRFSATSSSLSKLTSFFLIISIFIFRHF